MPHARDGAIGLARAYRVQQVTREQFEKRYAAFCETEGLTLSIRGLNTAYELYRADVASYRAKGQDFQTTNGQRAAALAARGRARCPRTVQRTRKRLEAMGLCRYFHVKRSGAQRIPGQLDTIRVCLLCVRRQSFVTPPLAAGTAPLQGAVVPASPALSPPAPPAMPPNGGEQQLLSPPAPPAVPPNGGEQQLLSPPAPPAVPPNGGDQRQPASPAVTERERAEAFRSLWRQASAAAYAASVRSPKDQDGRA